MRNQVPLSTEDKKLLHAAAKEVKARQLLDKKARSDQVLLETAQQLTQDIDYKKLRHPQAVLLFWSLNDITECYEHLDIVANSIHVFLTYAQDYGSGRIYPAHYVLSVEYFNYKNGKPVAGYSVTIAYDNKKLHVETAEPNLVQAFKKLEPKLSSSKTAQQNLYFLAKILPTTVKNLKRDGWKVVATFTGERDGSQDS